MIASLFKYFKNLLYRLSLNPKARPGLFFERRGAVVFLGFLLAYIVFIVRASILTLFPPESARLDLISVRQYQKEIELTPYRGFIFDRRGEPLAISVLKPSAFINPKIFKPLRKQQEQISRILGIPQSKVRELAERDSYFAWLKRQISQSAADSLQSLEIPGVFIKKEPGRFYPTQAAAGNLVGLVGIDNRGLAGLELSYDSFLRGESAKLYPQIDARSKPIYLEADIVSPERPGNNLHLSIDRAIQSIAESALSTGVAKSRGKSGFAIVSDPHSGQILAIANYPNFNPNKNGPLKISEAKNYALQDAFEPGSVVKPFVIGAALEKGLVYPEEKHNCENGRLQISRGVAIRDDHPKDTLQTTEEVLVHSSNVCTFKLAKRLGERQLYEEFMKVGFGAGLSRLKLPGESRGSLQDWTKWRPIRFANISFGQGFMATGLEIVQAYGSIANGGDLLEPYLLEKISSPSGEVLKQFYSKKIQRVFSPKTAEQLKKMLAASVTLGTGRSAATEHFTVAGKTGTSEKVDPILKTYSPDKRLASFAGFAPAKDPHIVIYVVVDEPKVKPYYGGVHAAPIFKEIAEATLKYLNVAPDKITPVSEVSMTDKKKKNG